MSLQSKRTISIANEECVDKVTSLDQEVLNLMERVAKQVAQNDLFEYREVTSKLSQSESKTLQSLIDLKAEQIRLRRQLEEAQTSMDCSLNDYEGLYSHGMQGQPDVVTYSQEPIEFTD